MGLWKRPKMLIFSAVNNNLLKFKLEGFLCAALPVVSIMTELPPIGWIIRFKPKSVGIFNPKPHSNQIAIMPNPASSFINIPEIGSFVSMYDFSGRIMYEGITNDNKLNVSAYLLGIYFIKITSGGSSSIGKFYKS
jgi:hypothetical protein